MNIVASSDTRSKIRSWFKRENREENIEQARQKIDLELKKLGYLPKDLLKDNRLEKIAQQMNLSNAEEMLAQIGYGGITLNGIITKLVEMHKKDLVENTPPDVSAMLEEIKQPVHGNQKQSSQGILVEGESGFYVRLAKCCNPIPGDEICGYVTKGRGVSIHRVDCPNILNGTDLDRMIEVSWDTQATQTYTVEIEIVCLDRSGVLNEIFSVPADMKFNIHSVHAKPDKSNKTSTVNLGIDVNNADQVTRIMNQLRRIKDVYSVSRPITE